MASMEDVFEAACKARTIPGAVLVATNRTGTREDSRTVKEISINYQHQGVLNTPSPSVSAL